MVIFQIDIKRFAVHKSKRDAPVAAHGDCPRALSAALESMKIEAMGINISYLLRTSSTSKRRAMRGARSGDKPRLLPVSKNSLSPL